MSSLGNILRQAREAKGLTQSQVASQTRILVQIIDDIENEDFHRIAAPIYGRGFVRLYAECVDLDPQPLIREFMDIYEGRRAPTVLVRAIPTEAPMESMSVPEPKSVPVVETAVTPDPHVEPTATADPDMEPTDLPESIEIPSYGQDPCVEVPVASKPLVEEAAPQEHFATSTEEAPEEIRLETEIPPQQTPFASTDPSPAVQTEPEHLWDPPTSGNGIATTEPPPIVRGLDLFDQAAGIPPPAPVPAAEMDTPVQTPSSEQTMESPFLPPIYEDNGPSAAERFKNGISSVSHGVLRSVRKIPRSTWRKAMLALVVVSMLAVMVLGCVKLYQMTTTTQDSCENGVCEYNPPAKNQAAKPQAAKPQAAKPAPQTPSVPQTTGKIHSTGQKVTPLYID